MVYLLWWGKMQIINKKVDFFLIKFPIIFPIIYFILLSKFPEYETLIIAIVIFFLAEPHFGATLPIYFDKVNKQYLKDNSFNLVKLPIFIIIITTLGFFFLKKLTLLIFFAANIYHVARQSVGVSKIFKNSEQETNFQKNSIYAFNILFFIVGYARFYLNIEIDLKILNIIVLGFVALNLLIYSLKFGIKNSPILITGIIIFYPICFVLNPAHAILMGVTMHYSQYLLISHKVHSKRNSPNKIFNKNFIVQIFIYSIIMTFFTIISKNNYYNLSHLLVFPIVGQMIHFYLDSQIWKFSDKHNRDHVLQHLIS